jgi:prepilin-type N-terminal cleavage/methylation domain-containing protein
MAGHERGYSLAEVLVVLGILSMLGLAGLSGLLVFSEEAKLLGVARTFKGSFLRARSIAVKRGVQTAIRFETGEDGLFYSIYSDGNHNGVLSRDIDRGRDMRLEGPYRLDGGVSGVRVGIIAGFPAPPPDSGVIDPSDPVRFGRSDMLSFSPLGTATPGTFYLATRQTQAAVRVTGINARVRIMLCRGLRWERR